MSGVLPDTVISPPRFTGPVANGSPTINNNNNNNSAVDLKCNCDSYIAWINAQLNSDSSPSGQPQQSLPYQPRQPYSASSMPVKDLSRDLRNGVVLARLAEKLGNERLEKVHHHPVTRQQMLTNVDEVLKFAMRWRVKMHPVLSTEIVDGDTRATLRLVLALAAHFRPASVIRQVNGMTAMQTAGATSTNDRPPLALQKHYFGGYVSNHNGTSELRNPALSPRSARPPLQTAATIACDSAIDARILTERISPISSLTARQQTQLYTAKLLKYKAVRSPRTGLSSSGVFTSPDTSTPTTPLRPPSSTNLLDDENDDCETNSRDDSQVSSPLSHEAQAGSSNGATSTSSSLCESKQTTPLLIDEQDFVGLESDIATAKKTLLALQQLLFEQDGGELLLPNIVGEYLSLNNGIINGHHRNGSVCNGGGNESTSVVGTHTNNNKAPSGCCHENADRAATLQLRAQIRELNLTLEELAVEKKNLECRIIDRDRQIIDMQASLAERDRLVAHLQAKVHDLISEGRREVAELKELAVAANGSPSLQHKQKATIHTIAGGGHSSEKAEVDAAVVLKSKGHLEDDVGIISNGKSNASPGCRIYYFNSDGSGPYCLFIAKPTEPLALRDIKQAFSRYGRKYRFRFVPSKEIQLGAKLHTMTASRLHRPPSNPNCIEHSLATLEFFNDDDLVPAFDGQVYCKLEEA